MEEPSGKRRPKKERVVSYRQARSNSDRDEIRYADQSTRPVGGEPMMIADFSELKMWLETCEAERKVEACPPDAMKSNVGIGAEHPELAGLAGLSGLAGISGIAFLKGGCDCCCKCANTFFFDICCEVFHFRLFWRSLHRHMCCVSWVHLCNRRRHVR